MINTRPTSSAFPLTVATLLAACVFLAAAPRSARAGEFTIASCQANGEYSSGAFADFATRGMKWRRACNPLGPGLRGLVTANVAGEGHVPVGSQSAFVLEAPPQTTISALRWSGFAHRRDCRYALQLYAVRPDGSSVALKNVRANRGCPKPDAAQVSSWPRPRSYQLGGATRIVQRVVCIGAAKASFCSARGQNYLETFTAEANVVDGTPPVVAITPGGPLVSEQWVAGTQSLAYEAADNTGIRSVQVSAAGFPGEAQQRPCDYTQRIPCPSGPGQLQIETQHLPEGTQQLHLNATDAAGNPADSAPVTVRIDDTPPAAVPVSVEGGEAWRNRDSFALVWQNPEEGDRAPIVAAHWTVCPVGGGQCATGAATGLGVAAVAGLAVPGPGEWEAQMWREDAAANTRPDDASVPVRLRFDPEPPQVGFEPSAPEDPTRVTAHLSDRVSGIAGGDMQLSRIGSGTWQPLPSTLEGEELVARIDDATVPAGEYQLRASATDRAGNSAASERLVGGAPMRLTLPLRTQTSISAGVLERRVVRKSVKRHGHRHVVKHSFIRLVPKATVGFGGEVHFAGTLTDRAGNPVSGARVDVFATVPEGPEAQVATLTTGADGGFGYVIRADSSRSLRFAYAGTATSLPVEGSAELQVHGRSSLEVSPDHVLNGRSVTFTGRVQGRPLPALGKLVELQVRLSHEWSTFRTIRSGADGSWRIPYAFKRTCGLEHFRFRVRLPGEAGYPLLPGHSPTATVTVKGRPC